MKEVPKDIIKKIKNYPEFYKEFQVAYFVHLQGKRTYKRLAEKTDTPKAARVWL